jgi:hypothetical protein
MITRQSKWKKVVSFLIIKKSLLITINLLFIFPINAYPQAYRLSGIPCDDYSIDRFTGDIYIATWIDGIWKTNINTKIEEKSKFPTLPIFANKTHKAVYLNSNDTSICLYDFEKDISIKLFPINIYGIAYVDLFSPNDNKLAVNYYLYNFDNGSYYHDSLAIIHHWGLAFRSIWGSDSSIIYSFGDSILEYFLESKRTDTLFVDNNWYRLGDFAPMVSKDEIFYSTVDNTIETSTSIIHLLNKKTKTETIIYDYLVNENDNIARLFSELKLLNDNSLAAICNYSTVSHADIYIYRIDSNKVYKLTDNSDNFGRKINLQWFDEETLLYINMTNGHLIYYYKIPQNISEVIQKNITSTSFGLINFPNPFNPTTVISYQLPVNSNVQLKIYDIMGKEVRPLVKGYNGIGYKEILWDGRNDEGQLVSSGIYLCRLVANSLADKRVFEKSIKLLFLK